MRIPALALAQRALLIDARSGVPYALRGLLVVFMLLALWTIVEWRRLLGAPGLFLLHWLVYGNFFFIALFGISTCSAVITEEKENQTLGLLKLAGFHGASILAGKSVGQLVAMVMLLLIEAPFALLAITLGGVSAHQVGAVQVILLAHLLFVYALGLCCSVMAPRSTASAALTGLALSCYYLLPNLGTWIDQRWPVSLGGVTLGEVSKAVSETSALQALTATTTTGFTGAWFGPAVMVTLGLAAVLFCLAGLLFEPCTRREVEAAPARSDRLRRGRGRVVPRLVGHPLFWKDYYFLAGGGTGMLLRTVAYGVLAVVLWVTLGSRHQKFGEATMTLMAIALALDLGIHASHVFRAEIESRTLPLLQLLPIPLWSWCYAKVAACAVFAVPAALFFTIGACCAEPLVSDLARGEGWFVLGLLVACLHLTVLMSLFLPRGAFAAAILLTFAGVALFEMMVSGTSRRSANHSRSVMTVILVIASLFAHPVIARHVEEKAGE